MQTRYGAHLHTHSTRAPIIPLVYQRVKSLSTLSAGPSGGEICSIRPRWEIPKKCLEKSEILETQKHIWPSWDTTLLGDRLSFGSTKGAPPQRPCLWVSSVTYTASRCWYTMFFLRPTDKYPPVGPRLWLLVVEPDCSNIIRRGGKVAAPWPFQLFIITFCLNRAQ